jgi:hypothetical protein
VQIKHGAHPEYLAKVLEYRHMGIGMKLPARALRLKRIGPDSAASHAASSTAWLELSELRKNGPTSWP